MLSRRNFVRTVCLAGTGLVAANMTAFSESQKDGAAPFTPVASPNLTGLKHSDPAWKAVIKGIQFTRIDVMNGNDRIDAIGVLRVEPAKSRIRVFHSFDYGKTVVRTIEEWQNETSAIAMINGAQYMADPYYMPCALVICDGKTKGPRNNKQVRGMLVAEPGKSTLPPADVLDFDYDRFDENTMSYSQGVQHWPILLDRNGKIKVNKTDWQANRSVVARDFDGNILFFTTEGGFFTLHNLGVFLKDSNARKDGGFGIHTAMNLDGGSEANMIVKSDTVSYLTYGSDDSGKDGNIFGWKTRIPGVIGVFSR